jgi:hypothetical protein
MIYELLPNKEVLYVVPVTSSEQRTLGPFPTSTAQHHVPAPIVSMHRLLQTADLELDSLLEMEVQCIL